MFKIGEKVVCINASSRTGLRVDGLVKNEIYTIQSIIPCSCGTVALGLSELSLPAIQVCDCGKQCDVRSYHISRFRKLDYDFAENLLAEIKASVQTLEFQN